MQTDYDVFLGKLVEESPTPKPEAQRVVQSMDGTQKRNPYLTPEGTQAPSDPDALFGQSVAYQAYKKEKPEHRLMLWLRLQGHNVKETAALTGYTPQTVSNVCKQPWFLSAFARLSSEAGKDAVQTLLEGEILPAINRTIDLANNAESEAIQLAANKELIDRFLGKATVKVEQKITGDVTTTVLDAAKLMEEHRRNAEILRSRGIGLSGVN